MSALRYLAFVLCMLFNGMICQARVLHENPGLSDENVLSISRSPMPTAVPSQRWRLRRQQQISSEDDWSWSSSMSDALSQSSMLSSSDEPPESATSADAASSYGSASALSSWDDSGAGSVSSIFLPSASSMPNAPDYESDNDSASSFMMSSPSGSLEPAFSSTEDSAGAQSAGMGSASPSSPSQGASPSSAVSPVHAATASSRIAAPSRASTLNPVLLPGAPGAKSSSTTTTNGVLGPLPSMPGVVVSSFEESTLAGFATLTAPATITTPVTYVGSNDESSTTVMPIIVGPLGAVIFGLGVPKLPIGPLNLPSPDLGCPSFLKLFNLCPSKPTDFKGGDSGPGKPGSPDGPSTGEPESCTSAATVSSCTSYCSPITVSSTVTTTCTSVSCATTTGCSATNAMTSVVETPKACPLGGGNVVLPGEEVFILTLTDPDSPSSTSTPTSSETASSASLQTSDAVKTTSKPSTTTQTSNPCAPLDCNLLPTLSSAAGICTEILPNGNAVYHQKQNKDKACTYDTVKPTTTQAAATTTPTSKPTGSTPATSGSNIFIVWVQPPTTGEYRYYFYKEPASKTPNYLGSGCGQLPPALSMPIDIKNGEPGIAANNRDKYGDHRVDVIRTKKHNSLSPGQRNRAGTMDLPEMKCKYVDNGDSDMSMQCGNEKYTCKVPTSDQIAKITPNYGRCSNPTIDNVIMLTGVSLCLGLCLVGLY